MSDFTNPASGAREAREGYVAALKNVVGERDPLEILRATTTHLRRIVDTHSNDRLAQPEAAGKWSALEVVQHLADSDLVWAWRLRVVLVEDGPQLAGYDQDAWADRLRYRNVEPREALRQFEFLRALNLKLLSTLEPDDFARVAVHSERGAESVADMLVLYAGHDVAHLKQLDRILG